MGNRLFKFRISNFRLTKALARLIRNSDDRGSALIIVSLLLALLTVYISASLTIATTDAISANFAVAQQRGFYTAYSKMEQMSRDFSALFLTSVAPTYDRMCDVVKNDPRLLNGFRVVVPPDSYSGQFITGSDIYDLGWAGYNVRPFCLIDVCNPNASPTSGTPSTLCGFPVRPPTTIQIEKGDFAGLQGFARRYRMIGSVESENRGGADVQVTRDFDNILLPLFQFGLFTESEFELYNPPNWNFGGWVHTNSDFFLTGAPASSVINFSRFTLDGSGNLVKAPAKITVAKHMVLDYEKSSDNLNGSMKVYYSSTAFDTIDLGSATNGAKVDNCNRIPVGSIDTATGTCRTFSGTSSGTVKIGVKRLQLPLQNLTDKNPIELIKRGMPNDSDPANLPLVSARYYYKPGIRVIMADYQNQLPREVRSSDPVTEGGGAYGGIQLDGTDPWLANNVGTGSALGTTTDSSGNVNWYYQPDSETGKSWPIPRGYQPKIKNAANGRPTGARVNGNRLHGWIKVEVVKSDGTTFDITEEILNLGVTVPYRANTGASFYYPRSPAGLPPAGAPPSTGPYPDENSLIHLQRFAAAYSTGTVGTGMSAPVAPDSTSVSPSLDRVDAFSGSIGVNFDYYAGMSMRGYNNSSLPMYGIQDDPDTRVLVPPPPTYKTRYNGTTTPYAEPQPDPLGYYTDVVRATAPSSSLTGNIVDFSGNVIAGSAVTARVGTNYLSENANLPKSRALVTAIDKTNAVLHADGETTWFINGRRLVPFPINMYDSREGVPHEQETGSTTSPVPGITANSVNKTGTMNLVEFDMGNLGRMFKGDFDSLFNTMGDTPFRTATSGPLTAAFLRDNITLNQDNGWVVYISDRRGDEPRLSSNPNIKNPSSEPSAPAPGTMSAIGDGDYNREDVIWSPGGNTSSGSASFVPVLTGTQYGCTGGGLTSDNKDFGKSPQDSNNDCFIQRETSGNLSETAQYADMFNADQYDPTLSYSNITGTSRVGNLIALTQVGTNLKPSWSVKPPVSYQGTASNLRIELFRRGVRLVNAANLFPTGPDVSSSCSGTPLGLSVASENPIYVFGHYNVPVQTAGGTLDNDLYPGLTITPVTTDPTSPARYYGQLPVSSCTPNCHVPAAIIADAITLLSSPNVGTTIANWSGTTGVRGWMDLRSFTYPYQALGYRSARNTVYRFALMSGSTPSWYPLFWTGSASDSRNQGPTGPYSSGGLNNFPRFLEDWRVNNTESLNVTYAGSMINIFKSRQGNGAFKREVGQNALGSSHVEFVYRPPFRDWVFDLDFNNPCTLPPGSPFLQLIDFKGFQQSVRQRQ